MAYPVIELRKAMKIFDTKEGLSQVESTVQPKLELSMFKSKKMQENGAQILSIFMSDLKKGWTIRELLEELNGSRNVCSDTVRKLKHNNIIKIIGVEETDSGNLSFQYQYVGSPLEDISSKIVTNFNEYSSLNHFYLSSDGVVTNQFYAFKEFLEKNNYKRFLGQRKNILCYVYLATDLKNAVMKFQRNKMDTCVLRNKKLYNNLKIELKSQTENSMSSTKLLQKEQPIKVEPVKAETSLLSKVKNFFSRKSPQLDSEFIEF